MNKSILKKLKLLKILNDSLIYLPTPLNINIWWNFGSLLGLCLIIQILTGIILSIHYCANIDLAFNRIIHIIQDVNKGWIYQLIHINGASFFFICIYIHIGRGIYYSSYKIFSVWLIGTLIFIITIATAFIGYVLPWGQMSFWGATVITNLISTIPYIGQITVEWVWGGFSVNNPTLNRFFRLHFFLPFVILALVVIHLFFIHQFGSNNPLGIRRKFYIINFHNYFTLKDIIGFLIISYILIFICLKFPFLLRDPENYILANPIVTPIHIQPEWYFLFAYTILRAIPNKIGGVIALLISIIILLILPIINIKYHSIIFYPINQILFWIFINNFLLLTWLGSQPVEPPFILIRQILSISYFIFYFLNRLIYWLWNKIIF